MSCRECGAPAGPVGSCRAAWDAVLAAEQHLPDLYRFHGVFVAFYLLQHLPGDPWGHHDVRYRQLQLFRERGLEGYWRFARAVRRSNGHRRGGRPSFDALAEFDALPAVDPPHRFAAGVQGLIAPSGDIARGDAYATAVTAAVDATLDAWRAAPTAAP